MSNILSQVHTNHVTSLVHYYPSTDICSRKILHVPTYLYNIFIIINIEQPETYLNYIHLNYQIKLHVFACNNDLNYKHNLK